MISSQNPGGPGDDSGVAALDVGAGDSGAGVDQGPVGREAGTSGPLGCTNDCHDYVISRVLLPSNSVVAQKSAFDWKGKKFNALGNMFSIILTQIVPPTPQHPLAEGICSGKALVLMRVKTPSFSAASKVKAQSWTATSSCCTLSSCANLSNGQCVSSAVQKCFGGAGSFSPDVDPTARTYAGNIAGSRLAVQGSRARVKLLLPGTVTPLFVELLVPQVRGALSADALTDGALAGVVDATFINNQMIPWMATLLNNLIKDPKTDQKTIKMILQLFDLTHDGTISADEIAKNALVKSFLKGDVDVNGDGINELSLGLGITAVKCRINAP